MLAIMASTRGTNEQTALQEQGYVVLRDVLDAERVRVLRQALEQCEAASNAKPAANLFEGFKTVRVYNLLARDRAFEQLPVHNAVLPLVEQVLGKGCLVSSLSSIRIQPGERAQPWHADDQRIPLGRPHAPLVCNTMWALTDFTGDNGATRLCPTSHLWDRHPAPDEQPDDVVHACMPAGSVLVWNGSLWHGGGENRTPHDRVGIAMNYCAGFVRQQENQQLGIARERAAAMEPALQRLLGYGIYRGLIGHIEKRDPIEVLGGQGAEVPMTWDRKPR